MENLNTKKKSCKLIYLFIAGMIMSLSCLQVTDLNAQQANAREIINKVIGKDKANSSVTEKVMILIDKKKQQRIRHIKTFSKKYGKTVKSLSFFLTPADVKNTAYLSFDWRDNTRDNEAWLYLPALKKPKQINSTNKSGSFMGGDFSYYDMEDFNAEKWNCKLLKSARVDGHDSWVIELTPKKAHKLEVIQQTGYLKIKKWVRKDNYMLVKEQLWIKKGKKIKYISYKDIRKIQGIWTAMEIKATTTKAKRIEHSTIYKISKIDYNKNIEDNMFTTERMEKGL